MGFCGSGSSDVCLIFGNVFPPWFWWDSSKLSFLGLRFYMNWNLVKIAGSKKCMASDLVLCLPPKTLEVLPGTGISGWLWSRFLWYLTIVYSKIHKPERLQFECEVCNFSENGLCLSRIYHKLCLVIFQAWMVEASSRERASLTASKWRTKCGRWWGRQTKMLLCDNSLEIWFEYCHSL